MKEEEVWLKRSGWHWLGRTRDKSWQTQLSGLIIKGKIVKIGDFGNIWNNFNNIGQELTHISNTTIGRYVNCQENNIALIALFFVIYLVFFFSYSAVEFK